MNPRTSLLSHFFSLLLITVAFLLVHHYCQDLRFSDPDQYFHYRVSQHWSSTHNMHTLPQVEGMGWDKKFVDKEFFFHVLTTVGYQIAGESGVRWVCALLALGVLYWLYAIAFTLAGSPWLALVAALFPLFSDVFVLHLMMIRAYVLALFFLLALIYFLLRGKKILVFLATMFFALSYHAYLLPLLVLVLFFFTQVRSENLKLFVFGFLGLVAGIVLNPFFPDVFLLSFVPIGVVLSQFSSTDLMFGPEQEPYRSDHFLWVMRFSILGLMAAVSFFVQDLKQRREGSENLRFLFSLVILFLLGSMVSPRLMDYFIPLVGLLLVASLAGRHLAFVSLAPWLVVFLCVLIPFWPYQGQAERVEKFKNFDQSYFSVLKNIPDSSRIFNCEWWGGHYAMYLKPTSKVTDVLDPTLLRGASQEMFQTVTQLRRNQVIDPYHLLVNVLKSDYVLCGTKTPLYKYLIGDPRFDPIAQAKNSLETVSLFGLNKEPPFVSVPVWRVQPAGGEAQLVKAQDFTLSENYFYQKLAKGECVSIEPESFVSSTSADFLLLSGQGLLMGKDLDSLRLGKENEFAEALIPLKKGSPWQIQLCSEGNTVSLTTLLMTQEQKENWCRGLKERDPQKRNVCGSLWVESGYAYSAN